MKSAACLITSLLAALTASAQHPEYRPHMDAQPDTYWDARLGISFPAKTSVKAWDDLWIWDIAGYGELYFAEFQNGGDLQVGLKWDAWVLNGFDGIGSGYPLLAGRFAIRYSQRYVDGFGLNFLAEPGLYSALEQFSGADLGLPFGVIAEKAFNPSFSAQIGAMIYPGFDQTVDPHIGLRFTNTGGGDGGGFTLDVGYPESRLTLKTDENFAVKFGARIYAWPEFQMAEDDKRDRLMFDETRIYGGVEYDITDSLNFSIEAGYLLGREIDFEQTDKNNKAIDIDDAPFVRFGIQGRL